MSDAEKSKTKTQPRRANGSGFGVGIVSLITIVSAACAVVIFVYENARLPGLKQRCTDYEDELVQTFESLEEGFVSISLAALGLDSIYDTKLLDRETIRQGERCAQFEQTMRTLYGFLRDEELIGKTSESEKHLDYCYMSARVLIYKSIARRNTTFEENESEIIRWLEKHEELASRFKNRLCFNYLLRGLLYGAQAELLSSELVPKSRERFSKSNEELREAIRLNKSNNPEDTVRVFQGIALSRIHRNLENQYIMTGDEDALKRLIDGFRSESLTSYDLTTNPKEISGPMHYANLAEVYMMQDSFQVAFDTLQATAAWYGYGDNESSILSDRRRGKPRKILVAIKGLESYCRIRLYLKEPELLTDMSLTELERDIQGKGYSLLQEGYARELLLIALDFLKASRKKASGEVDSARKLFSNVDKIARDSANVAVWLSPDRYMKPRVLIKRFAELTYASIIADRLGK